MNTGTRSPSDRALDFELGTDGLMICCRYTAEPRQNVSLRTGAAKAQVNRFGTPTAAELKSKRIGHRDEDWPDWYAAYMVAEQSGKALPL